MQSDRIVKFTNVESIEKLKEILKSSILEAVEIEKSGRRLEFKKILNLFLRELLQTPEHDPAFKNAFYALEAGRQRGYIIHFSQPKQSRTRRGRIEKYKEQIFNGVGLNDKYNR